MPTYEYRCEANGETLEVFHPMSRSIATWGELCEVAQRDLGITPAQSDVTRVLSATAVHTPQVGQWTRGKKKPAAAGHSHGPGCGCGH